MDVIGHQHIGMYRTPGILGIGNQPLQIVPVIILRKETRLPIVSPLDQVQRNTWQNDPWASLHGQLLVNGDQAEAEHKKPWSVPYY